MPVTIPTGDLTGIIGDALPFASSDADYPSINAVHLAWDGSMLHATATDETVIGRSSWHPDDPPGNDEQENLFVSWGGDDTPWDMSISASDAQYLTSAFKSTKKRLWTPLDVDYDPNRGRLRVTRAHGTGQPAVTVVLDAVEEKFPDVDAVFADGSTVREVGGIRYDPQLLGRFAGTRRCGPLALTFSGERSATLVAIGDRFVGAIIPAQPAEQEVSKAA